MRWKTDIERHRMRRTLAEVKLKLEEALRLMQRAGQRTAIVLSRERAEIGIVAVKDILKVMFGEMKL